jgi:tetrapyrrole methylase family protein/MazG family protein
MIVLIREDAVLDWNTEKETVARPAGSDISGFERLYRIVRILRGEDGCPWDREQTPLSMRGSLIEEAYELIEQIEDDSSEDITEELGDTFLILIMISYMYEQQQRLSLQEVFNSISDKLIRRHPHVFSEEQIESSEAVIEKWDQIKQDIEGRKKKGVLDSIPKSLPPLERSYKIQKKAAKLGFDWTNISDVFEKMREEINELEEAVGEAQDETLIEKELGDILFSLVNISRHLKIDPVVALGGCNKKFTRRFAFIEDHASEYGKNISDFTLDELEALWQEAKHQE